MVDALEDLLHWSWQERRKPVESFMLTRAATEQEGVGLLVGHDGSLGSCIDIDGARSMMGSEELDLFVETVERRLNTAFLDKGHALHLVFERGPVEGRRLLEGAAERQRRSCGRLGLDLEGPIGERVEKLARVASGERLTVACWSGRAVLAPDQARREKRAVERRKRDWAPGEDESQCPFEAEGALGARHLAFVESVQAVLEETGLVARVLDARDAVRVLRWWLMGPESVGDWEPATAAGGGPGRGPGGGGGGGRGGGAGEATAGDLEPAMLGAWPPPLAPQVVIGHPEVVGREAVLMGGRLWAPFDMELGPRRVRPFSELMARIAAAGNLPLRVSFLLEGGGLKRAGAMLRHAAAPFLAFSSSDSQAVRDASRALSEHEADGRAVVRFRVQFLTWIDGAVSTDARKEELARRASRLQQLVEGWGEIGVTRVTGDPLQALAMSAPGFACGSTAAAGLAPLGEALRMLPVSRPAPLARSTQFDAASHMFLSGDGKALPFGFEGENHGFDLIFGAPGKGKSVLLNTLGLAFCLQGGQTRLPLQAVIDIGPTGAGLVEVVRESLPPARRHEVGSWRWRMAASNAVNPMDTQLGCRFPLPGERAFLLNLLSLMVTPVGGRGLPDGMRELIGATVQAAYEMFSDTTSRGAPKLYGRGDDPEVDEALERHGIEVGPETEQWSLVDALFDAGAVEAAIRAQRRAVPTLEELPTAAQTEAVQGLVRDARYGAGGETVTAAFIRILAGLSSSWPNMFRETSFDVGNARLAVIDLGEVAPTGSPEADRQTAAFYMLARHSLTRDWWLVEEDLAEIPESYRDWHTRRVLENREVPKRLCYDEYHRTVGAPAVRAQVERDVREARKARVRLALSSQNLMDFDKVLIDLATQQWILGSGGKSGELNALGDVFGLSDTLREVARFDLKGPGPDGAPALLIGEGEQGRLEQLVVNAPGPQELWALSTNPRDVALRRRVQARLGPDEARRVLARAFPTGSATARLDHALRELVRRGATAQASDEVVMEGIARRLARAEAERGVGV